MHQPYAIHWFRRDLRLQGNGSFLSSFKKFRGRVLGVFAFDPAFLKRSDFSFHRFHFFLKTLEALQKELQAHGSDLLFLDEGPEKAFSHLFKCLGKTQPPSLFSWSRDYEPFARERDARIQKILKDFDVEVITDRDHLLIEPHEIVKASDPGKPFRVFTPFFRQWLSLYRTQTIQQRISTSVEKVPLNEKGICWKDVLPSRAQEPLAHYLASNAKWITIPIPEAGSLAAQAKLKLFGKRVENYSLLRDIPSERGTSQMSIYFKNGSLTGAQVIKTLHLVSKAKNEKSGEFVYLKELAWREFYYYILYHFPHVEKESFNPKYRHLSWENNEKLFEAWKEGKTGYPIVDAGMRQLKQTGWMHNRVRMITASFLTKDLLVDWRWGERYFMEQLLDGDLAPNNGGWQWSASTGCDPQPYFRIFNPTLQGEKFDPQGKYVKQFVPELKQVSSKEIHTPRRPIVDHAERREQALLLFKV